MPNNPLNLYTSQILQDELAKQAREKPGQLTLDEAHLAQLLGLVNEERGPRSPLPGIQRQKLTDPAFINLLVDKGWLVAAGKDGKLHPTAHSRRAVLGLLMPDTSIQLVLGGLTELSITALYSAEGYRKDALVIYTHKTEEDRYVVHPALSPSDLSDALLAHLLIGPREGLGFEFSLMQRPMLAYLAILDLVYTRRMEAKLRAELMPQLNFSAADLLARFAEIRLGEDITWLSALLPYLFPYLRADLPEAEVAGLLAGLEREGLLTPMPGGRYQPNDFTVALSEALLPTFAYASLAVVNAYERGLHLAFLVGQNVNLVIKLDGLEEDLLVSMTGMDHKQFSKLLFEIGLPERD